MKIDIIGKRHNWENMAILKSLRERGVDTDFLHPRRLSYRLAKGKIDIFHKRKPYELPDLVFSRLVPAGGRYFLNTLIGLGVKVPEPAPVVGRDKLVYATIFALHNIPHPITICGGDKTLDLIDFSPVVCKPSHGSQGHHITRHKSIRMARGLDYLLQPMISNRHEDLRVICLGGKVLGTTKRIAAKNKWKTNVAQGGKSVHVRTTPEVKRLALKATKACNLAFTGVDLMRGDDGWIVGEVNRAPLFKGFVDSTGIDVPGKLARFLIKEAKK